MNGARGAITSARMGRFGNAPHRTLAAVSRTAGSRRPRWERVVVWDLCEAVKGHRREWRRRRFEHDESEVETG